MESSEIPQATSTTPAEAPAPQAQPDVTQLPPEEQIDIDLFTRIKLRTATIESVEAVPKSKKLYRLQLDVGALGKRQIVSGIAQHYTPEDLVGQQIVIVANLKPAKLMGIESHGMLLAASSEGDGVLSLLTPSRPITAGAEVR